MREILVILTMVMSCACYAQSSNGNKLGIKTSINLSTLLGDEFQNPRPKYGYTAGAFYQINPQKKWSMYTELVGSFRGSRFSNGDTGYSKVALFYMDVAAMPSYKIDEKKKVSLGPYLSYLALSSMFKGAQQKAFLNDIGVRPIDLGLAAYYSTQGPIVGFQVGAKLGLLDANNGVNFTDVLPPTGTGGFIRNLSLEIGMLF
ncbi:MAG: outer membrane beta-barrel protein [Bacteroidia bacterium]